MNAMEDRVVSDAMISGELRLAVDPFHQSDVHDAILHHLRRQHSLGGFHFLFFIERIDPCHHGIQVRESHGALFFEIHSLRDFLVA